MSTSPLCHLRYIMKHRPSTPIFGICLGNQILALAAGASTYKMKLPGWSRQSWVMWTCVWTCFECFLIQGSKDFIGCIHVAMKFNSDCHRKNTSRHSFSQVWQPGDEPTGGGFANAAMLHHLSKPRLCGWPTNVAGRGLGFGGPPRKTSVFNCLYRKAAGERLRTQITSFHHQCLQVTAHIYPYIFWLFFPWSISQTLFDCALPGELGAPNGECQWRHQWGHHPFLQAMVFGSWEKKVDWRHDSLRKKRLLKHDIFQYFCPSFFSVRVSFRGNSWNSDPMCPFSGAVPPRGCGFSSCGCWEETIAEWAGLD